jgi:oxygen-independent coproporphyrinogen III oxidase
LPGLYVHVPFCVKKCLYCDFYSLPSRLDSLDPYIKAVVEESRNYSGVPFETIYIGGGTPSLLGGRHLTELISGLKRNLYLSQLVEATVELNPESATRDFLIAAKECGINRLSFGVQSLSDHELKGAGRIHNAAQAVVAIKLAQDAGFSNISADLMVGLPGQTWQSLSRSLVTLTDLGLLHLSVYCLSLEEGTPLAENPPDNLPSDDMQVELFEKACDFLKQEGFIHYEISNFALPGCECRHNLNYWRGGEYAGLGPAAASHIGGKRFKNTPDLDAYLKTPVRLPENIEYLGLKEKAAEEAMLRLRLLREGISIPELEARFGAENIKDLARRLEKLAAGGELVIRDSRYCLEPSRVLTSNPILVKVLKDY